MEKVITVKLNVDEVEAALDDYIKQEYGLDSKKITFNIDWEFRKVSGADIVVKENDQPAS